MSARQQLSSILKLLAEAMWDRTNHESILDFHPVFTIFPQPANLTTPAQCTVQIEGGADQCKVCEGLRKITEGFAL